MPTDYKPTPNLPRLASYIPLTYNLAREKRIPGSKDGSKEADTLQCTHKAIQVLMFCQTSSEELPKKGTW